jgi:hypothetical protein
VTRRSTQPCTYFAVMGVLKKACWELLAVLRRGKIHVGGGGEVGGGSVVPRPREWFVCTQEVMKR